MGDLMRGLVFFIDDVWDSNAFFALAIAVADSNLGVGSVCGGILSENIALFTPTEL